MKHFVGALVVTATVLVPGTAAFATPDSSSPQPAEYRAECESFYTSGKALFDPLIASPLKPVLTAVEAALCGENKHAPA
jgi:hypothetical protein